VLVRFTTRGGALVAFGRFRLRLRIVVLRQAGEGVGVTRRSGRRRDRSGKQAESLAWVRIAGVGTVRLTVRVDDLERVRRRFNPGKLVKSDLLVVVNDIHLEHAMEKIIQDVNRILEYVQLTRAEMHHPVKLLGLSAIVAKMDIMDIPQPGIDPKQTFASEIDRQP